ncbi:hypothetical protein SteCoe_15376 [Stentor coeruleus]|uniref:Uncharacterized protein n=1 Tax=Stentor coeruleus TaxID=5963 RepID=A0A1R2C3V5_9CILI|nr:hypothetical protein SteCoe_15376 [Stentor coeruleus]
MNTKKQAMQDLFSGFVQKFGDSAVNRSTISKEIKELIRSKSKITVKDLDVLEKSIHSKLTNVFKPKDLSMSPISKGPKLESLNELSKTPKHIKISPIKEPEKLNSSGDHLTYKHTLDIQRENMSNSGFFTTQNRNNHSVRLEGKSNFRLKHKYDEWGKIVRHESVKYHKELLYLKEKNKLSKLDYYKQLHNQVTQSKMKLLTLKKEQETDKVFNMKITAEHEESFNEVKKNKEIRLKQQQKDLGEFLDKKAIERQRYYENKKALKEEIQHDYTTYLTEEYKKRHNKDRVRKKIASENINIASNGKKIKEVEKSKIIRQEYEHLGKNAKVLDDSEKDYRDRMLRNVQKAHDLERLEKLIVVKPKTLKDYEDEANIKESFMLSTIKETEKIDTIKQKEKNESSKKLIFKTLELQVKEREEQKIKDDQWRKDQGIIWKMEDEIAHMQDSERKRDHKLRQMELKEFYDMQVQAKVYKSLADLQMTPDERKYHKKLYLELLENNN